MARFVNGFIEDRDSNVQPVGATAKAGVSPFAAAADHVHGFDTNAMWVATAPTGATSTGKKGQMAFDATYLYLCTADNTWKRIALGGWEE